MKKCLRVLLGALLLSLFCGMSVMAAPPEGTIVALGADLTPEQRTAVLELMGLTEEDLAYCRVITITNAEEHQYLDAYVDPAVIGTKSLSSVMVTPAESGHGVMVSTRNITYCTTGMYRNALLTAGVQDADVLVVGPTNLSGTAALIGAIKAYETMSGEQVSDTTVDTAMNELIATGEIAAAGVNSEEVEELIAYIKAKLATGELDSEADILDAIKEGEEEFGVVLSDEQRQTIVEVMMKIKDLGLDPNTLLDQAADLYAQYGDEIMEKAQDPGFWESLGNFFMKAGDSIAQFFQNLFAAE